MQDIRWKQRYQNYAKAFEQLAEIAAKENLNKFEQAGMIQIFEFTFELAWKVLKDKLNYEGFNLQVPREVIKQAFQSSYIKDGATWIDALDKRNLMAHTYDADKANEAINLIKNKYFAALQDLYFFLQNEIKK
jgi:nucleotidyltransferase substrate binding protein (TIGR01987 family)